MAHLPVVGKVPKGWLIAVGGGSVVVIGYMYYRRKQAAGQATTAAPAGGAGDPYPPDGTTGNSADPYSTDPETGMTYGDEQLYGGGFGGSGFGASGFPGATGGGTVPGGTGGGPGPGSFTSNAEWATYAESQLSGIVDPTALSAALGVYLTGRPATTDQESLIDQAVAIAGWPPVAGPGNNPPGIVTGGGGGGGQVTVPTVTGSNWLGAIHKIQAAGLTPSPAAKPSNAKDPITGQHPAGGSQAAKGSTVTLTSPKR